MKISNFVLNKDKSDNQHTFATIDIDESGWFRTKKKTVEIFACASINSNLIRLATWRLADDGSVMPKQDKINGLVHKFLAERSVMEGMR